MPTKQQRFGIDAGNGPANADVFHALILNDEFCRAGSGGLAASLWTPSAIALPPVLAHGSERMRREVAPAVISGEKSISLALTEPWTGSDLAHIRTTCKVCVVCPNCGRLKLVYFVARGKLLHCEWRFVENKNSILLFNALFSCSEKVYYGRRLCRLVYDSCAHWTRWRMRESVFDV
jgi:hypothetical protein